MIIFLSVICDLAFVFRSGNRCNGGVNFFAIFQSNMKPVHCSKSFIVFTRNLKKGQENKIEKSIIIPIVIGLSIILFVISV